MLDKSMMTVSQLARACKLSRTAVLYYESAGLLSPAGRSNSQYRFYGEKELERLRQIRLYRSVGLGIDEVRAALNAPSTSLGAVLKHRLLEVEKEITVLRGHQQAILSLLQTKLIRRKRKMTKQTWVDVMKAAGFSEADMHRWHRVFEQTAPDGHQEFLKFLNLADDEIGKIRQWSKTSS
jgi:DNA-binding transcriptional MerR regulator